MRTLKRPMFKIGGKAEAGNDGIMSGLIDREQLQAGTALEKFQSIGAGDIDFSGLDSDFDTTKRITLPSGETQQVITPQTGLSDKAKANLGIISRDDYLKTLTPKFPAGMTFPSDAAAMGADTDFTPTIEDTSAKDDTEPTITTKDTGSNQVTQAEKNEILKARAKEFEELLNPGARKRVINNALAAASGAFGKSTGNTMQDIANAITAAAGATSEIDKTKQKAAELAIGESIQKGIAREKKPAIRPNATESLINFYRESGLSNKEIADKISKTSESELDYIRAYPVASQGKAAYVSNVEMKDNELFGGVLSNDKKQRKEELKTLSPDKLYYDSSQDAYVKIVTGEDGKQTVQIVSKR